MLPIKKATLLAASFALSANTVMAEEIFISDREYSADEVEHLEFAPLTNGGSTTTETDQALFDSPDNQDSYEQTSYRSNNQGDPSYLNAEEQRLIEEALAYRPEAESSVDETRPLLAEDVRYGDGNQNAESVSRSADNRLYGYIAGTAFAPDTSKRLGTDGSNEYWPGIEIGFGTPLTQTTNFEFTAWTDSIDQDSNGNGGYERVGINARLLWFFAEKAEVHPFIALGAGLQNTRVDNYLAITNYEAQNEVLDFGIGAMFRSQSNGLGLRVELRNRSDFFDRPQQGRQTLNEWMLALGLQVPFGSVASGPAHTTEEPEEIIIEEPQIEVQIDSDNDGVMDNADQCPATIIGVLVDDSGCEVKPQEPIQPCSQDTVTDIECLPREMAVVLFGSDSAILSNKGKATLTRLADQMNAISDFSVIVTGHTDSIGDADYNLALAYRRAEAVKVFLIHKGVSEDRIRVATLGESEPTSDNETLEGRQQNRRVLVEKIAF